MPAGGHDGQSGFAEDWLHPGKNGASEDQGRTCPEIAGMQIVFDTIKVQASRKTAVSAMPAQGKRACMPPGSTGALTLHSVCTAFRVPDPVTNRNANRTQRANPFQSC